MPDKVQLFKQEIERLFDEYPMSREMLKHLTIFIDSLPEEPASVEENDCTTCVNDKGCVTCENGELYESAMRNDKYSCILEEPASKDRINECPHWEKYWGCETSPMNNCNSCLQAKWVEVKEEKKATVNDIRELLKQNNSKKSYCDKSLVKEDSGCEVNFTAKSEDLEESAKYYLLNNHVSSLNDILHQADLKVEMQYHKDIENAFKAGAEWQKEKINLHLQTEYEKGLFDMRQAMMKNAVDCVFGSRATSAFVDDFPNIEIGDKIKIIIVKED